MTLIKVKSRGTDNVSGRKNLIINGAMNIAQRGTEVTGLSSSNTYQTVDRMFIRNSGAGTFTNRQSTDNPGYGFRRSIEFDCTSADSLSAADFAYMGYKFEGFDAVLTKKGMTGAGDVTLSFWVKSSETGTAVVGINDSDNALLQNRQYTINAANTWEHKTITISFIDGTNTFNYDNAQSMMLFWWIASGTDRTSGSLQTSWSSTVTANEAAGQTVNVMRTTDSYIRFTGIQLEVGSSASDFEHRSFAEELSLCQRYYASTYGYGVTTRTFDQSYNGMVYFIGTGNYGMAPLNAVFPVEMRATPTVTTYGNGGTASRITYWNGSEETHGTINRNTRQVTGASKNAGTQTEDYYSCGMIWDAEL